MEEVVEEKKPAEKKAGSWWELVRFALIALLIVIPVRILVAQPFVVSGSSMQPTFENGDYLIIDELSYRLSLPKRYDVVVFRYPGDTKKFFIKRIIGLPNETVQIQGEDVIIKNEENPEGFKLDQPYVKQSGKNEMAFKLKDSEYFVMGDNRRASSDSRYWGPVPRKNMIGRPILRLLPTERIGVSPGSFNSTEE